MMKKPVSSQFALPLAPDQSPSAARIVVGEGNASAIAALSAPDSWPFRTAILSGPPRSGKSLLAAWFAESGGVALDDADTMDETAVFHRWNRAQEEKTPLLLTTTAREGGWKITLPDLGSRMGAALWLDIEAPDDEMMADLIAAHAETRLLPLTDDHARYLASRCERTHIAAERLVATIDRLSLERKAPPGQAILRDALEELNGSAEPRML
ncbi:chromosomal replication initiation ATPase DnaA [Novosphingobium sp. 1748]|uniref:ATPase n=2 Tax=unclassified Novosphingobium TaxID=2644732 RepID=UPI0025FFA7B6|nr:MULTISPECIES: ATPase [unclassified Novosphingobium]MDR6708450.1 chromosomal replication initiation ATPase DnaA [Novosphingobium sp. 1748]